MAPNIIYKNFRNFGGLDLRTSDLLRQKGYATNIKNIDFRDTGALNKCKGFKHQCNEVGASSLFLYKNTDIDTGITTEELLVAGSDLYILKEETITITYTGASSTPTISLKVDEDNKFKFYLQEAGVNVSGSPIDLGSGLLAGDMTVSTLETTIDALTDWAMSTPVNVGSEKAAFIPLFQDTQFSGGTATFIVRYLSQVKEPNNSATARFNSYWAKRGQTDFEPISSAFINDVQYYSTGFDEMTKYDGNRAYRAGLPQPSFTGAIGESGSGSFTASRYLQYILQYEYTDAKGNVILSKPSDVANYQISGTPDTITSINSLEIDDTIGFNTDSATISSSTSSVITFTAAHDFIVGDYIYFYDGTSTTKTRITAVTSTTATCDADVSSATGVVSCIKVMLYRNENDASTTIALAAAQLKYLVDERPHNPAAAIAFTDTTIDLSSNVQYIEPLVDYSLPPKGKYLTTWRGQLLMGGIPTSADSVAYSDIDSPEYFPVLNTFKVDNTVSGLGILNNLAYIFQDNSISSVTGDLTTDNISINNVSREGVGCSAHATINEVRGRLWFLSSEGVYSIGENGLKEESEIISTKFSTLSKTFTFKMANAAFVPKNDKYYLQLPVTNLSGSITLNVPSQTEILVFDIKRNAWLEWDTLDFIGNMVEYNDNVWFLPRSSALQRFPTMIQNSGTEQDYAFHQNPISCEYATHWETLGEPSIWKKFLRLKLHALDTTVNSFESDTFTLSVNEQHDWVNSNVSSTSVDYSGGSVGWGLGGWGEFPWGEPRLIYAKRRLASRKVKSHRFVFSNSTILENILISGYESEIVSPFKPALKE